MTDRDSEKKYIIIVGAGFGGLRTALTLARHIPRKTEYEIILIDRHHHHIYTPALYEVAAIPREYFNDKSLVSSILIPISEIIQGLPIRFIPDEVIGHDAADRSLILRDYGKLPYEYLVLALGSETNYFNIPGLQEASLPLKTCDDASLLRNKIETALKEKPSLKIVVGGAGASGVELIAELVNFTCALKEKIVALPHVCDVTFFLAEASPEILPGFDPWVVTRARKRLQSLGIVIKTGSPITRADMRTVFFADGADQEFDVLIWTGGVKGPSVFTKLNLPLSSKGTLVVGPDMRVSTREARIFAVGDNAWFENPETKKPLPWNAPAAEDEGRHVAYEILGAIRGTKPRNFQPRKRYPFILAVGGKYALADLVFVHIEGVAGWCIKHLVALRYFCFILPWPRALRLWWKDVTLYSSND